MASKVQSYTISHTGNVLGSEYVTRSQNQVNPQRPTAILSFEGPKKFEQLEYVGERDATRFVPRYLQSVTISDDDASGALEEDERTVSLNGDIQPIAGETNLDDQDYPAVVAYNTTQGARVDESELDVNYATDAVTIADSAVAAGDSVKLYPIINEGTVQYRAVNQFGQIEGTVYPWSTPVHRWNDMKQLKRGTEVNLEGMVEWTRYESVEVLLDSPLQIVWQDADYPDGDYVSSFEQDLQIYL